MKMTRRLTNNKAFQVFSSSSPCLSLEVRLEVRLAVYGAPFALKAFLPVIQLFLLPVDLPVHR